MKAEQIRALLTEAQAIVKQEPPSSLRGSRISAIQLQFHESALPSSEDETALYQPVEGCIAKLFLHVVFYQAPLTDALIYAFELLTGERDEKKWKSPPTR